MFTGPSASVLHCFSCTYRWPMRGCRSRQCLYYWSNLWPQEAHSMPQEGATIRTAILSRKRKGDMTSNSCHKALRSTERNIMGSIESRRDIVLYIPQSFIPLCHFSHMSACRVMSTSSYATRDMLENSENVTRRETNTEGQFCNQIKRYSSGQPLRVKKDEDKETVEVKETKEVLKGIEHKPASPRTNIAVDVSAVVDRNVLASEQLPSKAQRYFLWRYSWYLKRFQESLKNEMPDTFNMFRIFTVGVKEFIIDFKELITLLVYLSLPGSTFASLSRRELEVYYHMPGEMVRVFPVLLLSSLPFGQNVAFPIGYWFPRHLLSHHFWDIQQRHEFAVIGLQKRLFNARPVFRSLQAALITLKDENKEKCRTVFFKLGSGIHPTVEEIVALVPLFQGEPFHIKKMGSTHLNALLRLHGRSVWLRRRRRLTDHAHILHCMDTAISKEGIDSLTHENLKNTLIFRGLNPTNMSKVDMLEYMQNWLKVSREVDDTTYSLLLHLPIFLAYNQPSNFALIYS